MMHMGNLMAMGGRLFGLYLGCNATLAAGFDFAVLATYCL